MTEKRIKLKTINNETLLGTGNIEVSVGEDYGTFTELQTLINNAQDGDTIFLDKDYKNNGDENDIIIEKSLKIIGNGHIIDGENDEGNGIFNIRIHNIYIEVNVTLENICFINGMCNAIYESSGVNLTIFHCIFANCFEYYDGGALCCNGDVIVKNSTFINNKVEADDWNSKGGAVWLGGTNSIIEDCTFVGNTASATGYDGLGGAIYIDGNNNQSKIRNCTFIGNTASTNGGGIYSSTSNFKVYNCTFESSTLYNTTNVDYLTEHQSLKTINSQSLIGSGNIDVSPTIDSDWVSNSTNPVQSKVIKTALDNKLDKTHTSYKGKNVVTNASTGAIEFEEKNNHTHSQYITEHQSLSNYVTTSDSRLSDARTPLSHSHGNLQNNGQVGSTAQANKNVVTNSSGLITTEDKPTIPSASSTTPSADTTNGSVGTGTTWARSNHTHPKSNIYASSDHNHTGTYAEANHTHNQYLTSHQDISNKENIVELITGTQDTTVTNRLLGTITKLNSLQEGDKLLLKTPATASSYGTGVYLRITLPNGSTNDSLICDENGNDITRSNIPENTILLIMYKEQSGSTPRKWLIVNKNFNGDYNSLTNKPTIPSKTSDLANDSGFLTSHQSLTGYLQQSDVKNNLTSTDTNKPLSANQGKELKTLIDSKEDNIEIFTGSVDRVNSTSAYLKAYTTSSIIEGKIILYKVPNISSIELTTNVALDYYTNNQTSSFYRKYVYKNGVQLTFGDIESNSWILLAYDGTVSNGQWNLISSSSYAEANHTHSNYLTSHQDVSDKEDKSNKVTDWSNSPTDTHYPSEKLTKDTLDTKLSFSELVSYYDKYTDEIVITKGYTITNATELANAIANIRDGETLYLKNGTYTLSEEFSLPNCTIYGENATIKEIGLTFEENGNSNINISGITFDGNNVQNMRSFIVIQTITDVHIHNCTFTNKRADWNGDNIFVYQSDANHSVEIDHCTFTGDNYCNGYGHTKASIVYDGGQGYSTAYNISIHHNTFNHNENVGDSNNLYNGRAICFLYATLNNSVAYCNTYVGSGDTNNGITESQCTD